MKQHNSNSSLFKNLSILIFTVMIVAVLYIMYHGLGLIKGLEFGPGSYYYTDIPGWEEIFWGEESINVGTNHPVLFFTFFAIWGLFCYKLIKWIDRKN